MAQSTTNLGKIHVFPSETLYNQFKDIIADNDLALLKDDGAYIVAALLEQNGYVKFSNGLILQWGYAQKPTSEYDFYWVYPIPFPTLVGAIMLTPQYEGQCRVHSINSFDRFSCSFRTDGTRTDLNSNHVFAIGFQQWGFVHTRTTTVKFNIPFTKVFACVGTNTSSVGNAVPSCGITNLTNSSFTMSVFANDNVGTSNVTWMALGA